MLGLIILGGLYVLLCLGLSVFVTERTKGDDLVLMTGIITAAVGSSVLIALTTIVTALLADFWLLTLFFVFLTGLSALAYYAGFFLVGVLHAADGR